MSTPDAVSDAGLGLADLGDLVDAVLLPGFGGHQAPDWLRRRISRSLGGVCLFARNVSDAGQLRALTDSLRAERADVVVSVDEEAGDVTRLDAATGSRFPGNAALGRVDDIALTEQVASEVGALLARAGITVNLAPCADVMVDPLNPVIGIRSFGSDPALVARHTAAFVTGQQAAGVAACAKHFPGHGDTDADTHLSLAVLDSDLETIRAQALPPFRAAIDAGVAAVMAGHLLVPEVDDLPATVSRRWLTDVLRGDLGFTGAVITDALEMAAISATYGIGEGAVMAVAAGADLLCLGGEDAGEALVDEVAGALMQAVRSGRLTEDRLLDAARRSRLLAVRPEASGRGESPVNTEEPGAAALRVARRALEVAGPLPALGDQPLFVRCEARTNLAVGSVPWGPATCWPGAPELVIRPGDPIPIDRVREAPAAILVTRDRHRHPFMAEAVARLRAARPDLVVIEMGTTGLDNLAGPAVASFGAGRVNTLAVVDVLRRGHQGKQ